MGGEDISGHNAEELTKFRREKVGFVFQSVNLAPINYWRNLASPIGPRTWTSASRRLRSQRPHHRRSPRRLTHADNPCRHA